MNTALRGARRSIRSFLALSLLALTLLPTSTAAAAPASGNPSWRILVLVYERTDFTFTDGTVTRRVVAQMTDAEKQLAADASTAFFTKDVPELNSRSMLPTVTIRYPGTITDLEPFCGWWPAPWKIASALDPSFDSVVVIWDSSGTDVSSSQSFNLQNCGGLALPNGTGQTFATFQVDSMSGGSRNIFKHEWGHSILSYYEAAGTAPNPAVDNHQPQQYVNCKTGKPYILVDETPDTPIRNSIYNNKSGFTHDYYCGTTAFAGSKTCLGITRDAWASGGPVSKPDGRRDRANTAASSVTRIPVHTPLVGSRQ